MGIAALNAWSTDQEDTLRRLWDAGLTGTEIARQLPFSRSAILGKAVRLKLAPRRLGDARASAAPKPRKRAPRKRSTRNLTRLRAAANGHDGGLKALPEAPAEPPTGKEIKLPDLRDETCRWPKGTPGAEDFFFCGEPTANLKEGRPYCPFHAARAVNHDAIRDLKAFDKSALFSAR